MAHKTLIGGTAYEVSGGKTLIGSTAYEISGGKTLIGGTGYDISFKPEPLEIFNGAWLYSENTVTKAGSDYAYYSVQNQKIYLTEEYGSSCAIDVYLPLSQTKGYTKLCWTGYAYQSNTACNAGASAKYGVAKTEGAKSGNYNNPAYNMANYNATDSYGVTWVDGGARTGVALTETTYTIDISSVAGQDYVYAAFYGPGGTYASYGYSQLLISRIWLE